MENIDDYDENIQGIVKQIDRLFKKAKTAVRSASHQALE
jgi:hypothetical protein